MSTIANLIERLKGADPTLPLIFETKDGPIRAGYHVTELIHTTSKGINCGGQIETWQDSRLQILDGDGETHMPVGKFGAIVQNSLKAMPELADGDLIVEFGHDNNALNIMTVDATDIQEDAVFLHLSDKTALCKPAQKSTSATAPMAEPCCGTTPKPKRSLLDKIGFERKECCA